jgi:hypothetical protein
MSSPFKLDTSELEKTTRLLAELNGKDLATATNKKMGWLLRRWLWNTPKADRLEIGKQLSSLIYSFKGSRRTLKTATRYQSKGQQYEAPVAALIINSVRAKQGKKGLYGDAMAKAVKNLIGGRQRSSAYLKSGIATALKPFLPFASGGAGPPLEKGKELKPVGQPKGFGIPAQSSSGITVATAIDKTLTKRRGDAGLMKIAKPALEQAYRDELADTEKFYNEQLYQTAKKIGITCKR